MIKFLFLFLVMFFSGCALKINGESYLKIEPEFKPEVFFSGRVKAWGIVQNRSGNVVQQFQVDINGRVDGGKLILDETFDYLMGDGVKNRTWEILIGTDHRYTGAASDIEGPAQGERFGNAMHWRYDMALPVGGTTYNVSFEDWMWAFDDTRLINRSYITKFGLVMAEVTIYMERL